MNTLPIIYFTYMFISLYFLFMTLLLYFQNRRNLFFVPEKTETPSISVIIPAYNEQNTIEETIKHVFNMDYKNILEVLVINDGSTDNTLNILKKLIPRYKHKLKILNKKNTGKADSLNKALKLAKGNFITVIDADSYPAKDSFSKLIGSFSDPEVGAATAACVPRNRHTFFEKLQVIEYKVIAFSRKLLEFIDSIYVTPGTLTIYRKKAIQEVGFDPKNMTEDIEATWHLLHNRWKIRMCLAAKVTTTTPHKIKDWFIQRKRWTIGGMQCLYKYRKDFLRKKANMLGYFIIPFFAMGLFLGVFGIGIFAYVFTKRVISEFLIAKYSIATSVPIVTMSEIYITPTILNYFGIVLFVLFLTFTLFVLSMMKDAVMEKQSFFNLMAYMFLYVLFYAFVRLAAIKDMLIGKVRWR